jgi:queuine tRNA-ribosyltransferase
MSGGARIFRAPICITCSAAGEALGGTLLSIANLYYYQELMAGARAAIGVGRFVEYCAGEIGAQWAARARSAREQA